MAEGKKSSASTSAPPTRRRRHGRRRGQGHPQPGRQPPDAAASSRSPTRATAWSATRPSGRRSPTRSRTIYSIKRFMGRRHNEVETEEKLVPYKIVGGPNDLVKVDIDGKQYTPPEISAHDPAQAQGSRRGLPRPHRPQGGHHRAGVLQRRPAAGDHRRRPDRRLRRVAARIINEPTAASLAYGLDKKKNEKIAVFDLGGGTFDISILDVGDGVFEVKATNGDTHLGGDDFDQVLIDYIADEFKKENGIDLRKDQMALQRLKEAAERAKKDLSPRPQTDINLPFITADATGPKHLQMTITRAQVRAAGRPPDRALPRTRC